MELARLRPLRYVLRRGLSSAANTAKEGSVRAPQEATNPTGGPIQHTVKIRAIDRFALVRTGRYKRAEDVPDRLPYSTVSKAMNQMRVKLCNYMIVILVIACAVCLTRWKDPENRGQSMADRVHMKQEAYNKMMEEKIKREGEMKL